MQSCFVKHVQDPCLSSTFSPFLSCKIYDIFFPQFLSLPQKDSSLCHKYYKSIVNLHVVFIEQYDVLKSLKGLIDIQKKSYKSSFNSNLSGNNFCIKVCKYNFPFMGSNIKSYIKNS